MRPVNKPSWTSLINLENKEVFSVSYAEGDWVVDIDTGRVGILAKKHWCEVAIRFGKSAVSIRYPEAVELAPLDIRNEDLLAMQHLAVNSGDREWFCELGKRMGVEMLG
jgi:hypothetical protein